MYIYYFHKLFLLGALSVGLSISLFLFSENATSQLLVQWRPLMNRNWQINLPLELVIQYPHRGGGSCAGGSGGGSGGVCVCVGGGIINYI